MSINSESLAFSPNGEYLALSTPDGRLKLWDTATSVLKQEYTPSSHLSSTCSCLAWSPARHRRKSPRKKRKKLLVTSNGDDLEGPDFIAMGTSSGSVLLYSMLEADLHTQLDFGHTNVVNDVCWNSSSSNLFSCSGDQHIVNWDITKSKIKYKWKADRHSIFSICLVDDENLLSASRSIKWWDLNRREVLKKFTGHATEVFRLLSVQFSDTGGADSAYFMSAARDDRLVNAWQHRQDSDVNAIASFTATEEIVQLDVSKEQTKSNPVLLAAVSQNGILHVYEHQLNGLQKPMHFGEPLSGPSTGQCRKPLEPCVRLTLSTEGAERKRPRHIPILAACVLGGQERRVLIAYGSLLRPTFEEIIVKECKAEEWLIRQDFASASSVAVQQSVSKIKQADRSSVAQILAPGFMTPSSPLQEGFLKRRDPEVNQAQLPMEERLLALDLSSQSCKTSSQTLEHKGVPSSNNLVHLLLQGLQSSNTELLNNVLFHNEDSVIDNTVRCLPLPALVPLLKVLHKRLHSRGIWCQSYLKWVKCILFTHTSYIMTCPDVTSLLAPMSQLVESRTETFSRLSLLRGKLDLLLSQISSKEGSEPLGGPLLTYLESSDEEDVEDTVLRISETEDDWEEEIEVDPVKNHQGTSSEED